MAIIGDNGKETEHETRKGGILFYSRECPLRIGTGTALHAKVLPRERVWLYATAYSRVLSDYMVSPWAGHSQGGLRRLSFY